MLTQEIAMDLDIAGIFPWLLGVVAVVSLLYIYFRKENYWKTRGVAYVKTIPLFGSSGFFMFKSFHIEEEMRYKKYGRIYGAFEGSSPVLSVGDPHLLKNILVKDFPYFVNRREMKTGNPVADTMVSIATNDEWKRIRTIITPAFTSGKLRKVVRIMNDCSKAVLQNFMETSRGGVPVECKRIFGAFTMDVICSSAFGMKIDSYNDNNNPLLLMARKMFNKTLNWRVVLLMTFPSIMKSLKISVFPPLVINFFQDVTLQLIKERKSGRIREDFFQILLDSSKEVDAADDLDDSLVQMGHEEENKKVFQHKQQYKNLTINELLAQSILFFLAGYETTASTLACVAYNLAQHPDCQEKLIQEIDELFSKKDEVDYDDVKKLQYLDCVICETLRLYPPAVRSERKAEEDYKLGDTGITVPKGMIITIPIYAIHRDEEFYPDPEKFDPLRFLPENKVNRNPYTYIPFGAGPRNCIGMRFAQMEMKLCLVQVLRKIRFKICPETKVPMEFFFGGGILAPKEVTLAVEVRTDVPTQVTPPS